MIDEFALDPSALCSYERFRYFMEKFGVSNGRLISLFPDNWKNEVARACREHDPKVPGALSVNKVVELLWNEKYQYTDSRLLDMKRPYEERLSWLENAEREHNGPRPFHAIVASANPRNSDDVLVADSLDETNQNWKQKRERRVDANSEDLARQAFALIRISDNVVFVDPHFEFVDRNDPALPSINRFEGTLRKIFEFIQACDRSPEMELHTRYFPYKDSQNKSLGVNRSIKIWEANCRDRLATILPKGLSITVFRWGSFRSGDPKEKLHPRYILTEKGGIRYERGLDADDPGVTTDVSLLDDDLRKSRWEDYKIDDPKKNRSKAGFDLLSRLTILGEQSA
jgi:hypothetical protein